MRFLNKKNHLKSPFARLNRQQRVRERKREHSDAATKKNKNRLNIFLSFSSKFKNLHHCDESDVVKAVFMRSVSAITDSNDV